MKAIRVNIFLLLSCLWCPTSVDAKPQSRVGDTIAPLALSTTIYKEAKFDDVDQDGSFRFVVLPNASSPDAQAISSSPDDLVWWGGPINQYDQPLIRLNDDSILGGFIDDWNNQSCRIVSKVWEDFTVPNQDLSAVLYYMPENLVTRQTWLDRLNSNDNAKRISDRVWTRRGDFLDGKIESLTSDSVSLNIGGQTNRLSLDAVALIEFAPQATNDKQSDFTASHQFCFLDGTRLNVNQFNLSDQQVSFTSKWGRSRLSLKNEDSEQGTQAKQLVCGIRSLGREGDYLSNRKPSRYQHQPLLGNQVNFRNNRNLNDTAMKLPQIESPLVATYGIAISSRSSLIYQLVEPVRAIQFGVALSSGETRQKWNGHVACKVLGLNKEKQWLVIWERNISAEDVVYVHLPIEELSAVALAVDYGQDADIGDRVNWLMPRLVR